MWFPAPRRSPFPIVHCHTVQRQRHLVEGIATRAMQPSSDDGVSTNKTATPTVSCGTSLPRRPLVVCSGCGLPPRRNLQGEIVPLRKCTRCGRVAYHNVHCQKKHYPLHKKQCRQTAKANSAGGDKEVTHTSTGSGATNPVRFPASSSYCVQQLPDKGRGMIAAQDIATGQSIARSGTSSMKAFVPVVSPVLFQNQRTSRCAMCFGTAPDLTLCHDPRYTVKLCRQCRESNNTHVLLLLEKEVEVVQATPQVPKILSTAMLIFRLYFAVTHNMLSWEAVMYRMMAHPQGEVDNRPSPDAAAHHEQAVILTVMTFLRSTIGNKTLNLTQEMSRIQGILSRIKVNAFTITDNATAHSGESLSLGLGLFHTAHFINHSCIPNTRQSFTVGVPGQLPALHVTSQSNIASDEEITISYIETNQRTTKERQAELQESYRFTCTCRACESQQRT